MFDRPLLLLLFMPLTLFSAWFSLLRKNRGGIIPSAGGPHCLSAPGAFRIIVSGITDFIFIASLLMIAFSISGPNTVKKSIRYLSSGNDYFILLDISPSMALPHGREGRTRLEAAKETAVNIASSSGNDYPGLIIFGSSAVVSLLPTPDRSEFLSRLESVSAMDLGDATALGSALGTALYYLRDSASSEKRIILISDGGNNYGELPPLDAAALAAGLGIPVSCIAIGSAEPDREVVIDKGDNDAAAVRITGSYHPEILEKIAEYSGGYYLENPGRLAAGRLAAALKSSNEKTETRIEGKSLAHFFLMTGVLLLSAVLLFRKFITREILT